MNDSAFEFLRIPADEMDLVFTEILLKHGFTEERAMTCAAVFTENSVDGIYTHGVNRFPRFIEYIKKKYVLVDEVPVRISGFGSMEQWNGNLGPGPLNALHATARATEISKEHGMECVAMYNTNH